MTEPILVPPGGGELVGDSPERRVEILSDELRLHATWSRFGPHREGADLHVHRRHTDLFYVLEGELALRLGAEDRSVALPAGTLARLPPLVVHGFRNSSDAEVRYLNLHAPGQAFADYLRALRDGRSFSYDQYPPPPDGGRPSTEAAIGTARLAVELPGVRIELLGEVEEIAVAETRIAPGALSPPHVHARHVESLYVLEGEVALTAAGRDLRARPGSWLQVPAGVPHSLAVDGSAAARFLDLHTPSCGFGRFLRGLSAARSDDRLAALRAAFDQAPA
ncbi:MAG: cupin domain-containing protein [Thermoleophilia bacterium]|nr:cupin domain-containing protein [Thermoleophilia bacterium]